VSDRIGLLLPAANVTVEAELAPRGDVHFQRFAPLLGSDVSAGSVKDAIVEAARVLAAAQPERIGVAYASGSYLEPSVLDVELVDEIERATGAKATTAAQAIVARLRELGATRVGVVSPYADAVNSACRDYLAASGIEVVALVGEPPAGGPASVTADEVRALVLSIPRDGIDAIAISCTGLRTLALLPELEQECGLPVVSSNQALLEALTA
jgi:maleate isomerase